MAGWWDFAACYGMPAGMFYDGGSDEEPKPARKANAEGAKDTCAQCPVKDNCLEWAMSHTEFGIWGGLDEKERYRLKRRRAAEKREKAA